MRIIGGHDYYDSGLAFGQDENLIFLRNEDRKANEDVIEVELGIHERVCSANLKPQNTNRRSQYYRGGYHRLESLTTKDYNFIVKIAHVVICGTLYNGLHILRQKRSGSYQRDVSHWIWTPDALRQYAAENKLILNEGSRGIAKRSNYEGTRDVVVQTLEEWMTPVKLSSKAIGYLVSNRITIAVKNPTIPRGSRDKNTWDIDKEGLKEMEFVKVLDPYTLFQEISMWLGGVLPKNGPQTVEITDNRIKIEKHGFHHPTSFRREKQAK